MKSDALKANIKVIFEKALVGKNKNTECGLFHLRKKRVLSHS